jgi:predicted O-methyltransferase YrrM
VNAERRALATQILAAAREHDAAQEDRLDRYRVLEPETAELLAFLVRVTNARDVLEIGTSIGYSTLWLADAVADTQGRLVSVEIEQARSDQARANLDRAGLGAELVVGDAAIVLESSSDDAWDLVFLDAERPAYAGYWPDVLRTLRPGGLVAIDNVLSHPDQVTEILALIAGEASVTATLVPIGAGLQLALKR